MLNAEPASGSARAYRGYTGVAVLVVCALASAYLLGDAVVNGSWGQMLLYAPWVLLVLWTVYVVAVASAVRVDADGVAVTNMLRTTRFGWRRATDVDLTWQLDFRLDDGRKLSCWGGPGRARAPRPAGRDGGIRVPASLGALGEIRALWERALDAPVPPAGTGADAPIRRTWDLPVLAALVVIVIWAVAAVMIVNS